MHLGLGLSLNGGRTFAEDTGPPNLDCSVFLGSDTVFFGGQRLFFMA